MHGRDARLGKDFEGSRPLSPGCRAWGRSCRPLAPTPTRAPTTDFPRDPLRQLAPSLVMVPTLAGRQRRTGRSWADSRAPCPEPSRRTDAQGGFQGLPGLHRVAPVASGIGLGRRSPLGLVAQPPQPHRRQPSRCVPGGAVTRQSGHHPVRGDGLAAGGRYPRSVSCTYRWRRRPCPAARRPGPIALSVRSMPMPATLAIGRS